MNHLFILLVSFLSLISFADGWTDWDFIPGNDGKLRASRSYMVDGGASCKSRTTIFKLRDHRYYLRVQFNEKKAHFSEEGFGTKEIAKANAERFHAWFAERDCDATAAAISPVTSPAMSAPETLHARKRMRDPREVMSQPEGTRQRLLREMDPTWSANDKGNYVTSRWIGKCRISGTVFLYNIAKAGSEILVWRSVWDAFEIKIEEGIVVERSQRDVGEYDNTNYSYKEDAIQKANRNFQERISLKPETIMACCQNGICQ